MQALQYTRIVREIVKELKVQDLLSLLNSILRNPPQSHTVDQAMKDRFAILCYGSRAGFERLMADPQASKVVSSLHINEIYEPTRLARIQTQISNAANVGQVRANPEIYELHSLLISLENLAHSCIGLLEKEKLAPAKAADEILELQVMDYDGQGIRPLRLSKIISLIVRLHANFARILGIKEDRLSFIYFDSGSDLLIGIQAANTIIKNIRILFEEYWERIRFRDFESFDKKMDVISKSLSVAGTVEKAIDAKEIDRETGNILKARIFREVDDLIGLGASLPVYGDTENVDHRKLLAAKRDTKLLGSGDADGEEIAFPSVS